MTPSLPENSASRRLQLTVGIAGISLLLSAVWEPLFFHKHEQLLQIISILLIAAWAWISSGLVEAERRLVEKVVFLMFAAMVCIMTLRPDWLNAEPRLLTSFRGMPRWKGWTVDSNNTGVVLALATVVALRLREEVPKRFSMLLLALAALCALQLIRSYSRIGMLAALLALLAWLSSKWRICDSRWKFRASVAALVFTLSLPMIAPLLRSSDVLLLRRAASITNIMDLSWANRLYVLPGTIQAMLDRPLFGWGWGKVLPIHQKIYSPTFLADNTAVLLNDYAHLGASYGIPLVAAVIFIIVWCLLYGRSPYAKMTLVVLAVAMFFQGVVRIPLTVIPLCISLGILLGEHPPWKKASWKRVSPPIAPTLFVLAFLGVWCVAPFMMTNKRIRATQNEIIVSPKTHSPMTIVFVTEGQLADYGRELRAVASFGLNSAIIRPQAIGDYERSGVWFIANAPGERRISPDEIKMPTAILRGVQAVRKVFDAAKVITPPTPPSPDKPFPIRFVIITLFACALLILIRECAINSRHPYVVGIGVSAASLFAHAAFPAEPNRIEENRQAAEWAQQMYKANTPDEVYYDYVLNPDITPGFRIRSRREMWHTFYQTTRAENPSVMLNRIKEAIESQVLTYPDTSMTVRPFEEIWRTRTCNFYERHYLLVAVIRTLNMPARMNNNSPEIWIDGQWIPIRQ